MFGQGVLRNVYGGALWFKGQKLMHCYVIHVCAFDSKHLGTLGGLHHVSFFPPLGLQQSPQTKRASLFAVCSLSKHGIRHAPRMRVSVTHVGGRRSPLTLCSHAGRDPSC